MNNKQIARLLIARGLLTQEIKPTQIRFLEKVIRTTVIIVTLGWREWPRNDEPLQVSETRVATVFTKLWTRQQNKRPLQQVFD